MWSRRSANNSSCFSFHLFVCFISARDFKVLVVTSLLSSQYPTWLVLIYDPQMLLSCLFFFNLSWWNDIKQNPDDANDVLGLMRRVPGISEGTGMGKLLGCWVRWLGESEIRAIKLLEDTPIRRQWKTVWCPISSLILLPLGRTQESWLQIQFQNQIIF